MAMPTTGTFICLEGVDGGGKSGAVLFLNEALSAAGHDVLVTREPGGTAEGLALRRLLLAEDAFDWLPMAELLLINAGRVQHAQNVIRPAIAGGKIVLCDRFVASTIAYQGAGRGIPQATIREIHHLAVGDLWPDLTVVLDVNPRTGIARSRKRLDDAQVDEGRFEGLDLDFHDRVRQSFLAQAAEHPKAYVVVDAGREVEGVHRDVLHCVATFLAARGKSRA